MPRETRDRSKKVAVCGVFSACTLVFLFLAGIAPSGRVGIAALAGIFPMGAVLMTGQRGGYFCWGVSGLLGIFLIPDKGIGLLYLLFLGLYPILKGSIESIRKWPLELCCKLIYFNAVFLVSVVFFQSIFQIAVPDFLEDRPWLLFLTGNLIFFCYDFGISQIISKVYIGRKKW